MISVSAENAFVASLRVALAAEDRAALAEADRGRGDADREDQRRGHGITAGDARAGAEPALQGVPP